MPFISSGVSVKIDIEQTTIDKEGHELEKKVTNDADHTIEFHVPPGKTCNVTTTMETCTFLYDSSVTVYGEFVYFLQDVVVNVLF